MSLSVLLILPFQDWLGYYGFPEFSYNLRISLGSAASWEFFIKIALNL